MRYELTDHEWIAIRPMLPNKPRGVSRVNDRRVLNGIFWVLRSGAPWRDELLTLLKPCPDEELKIWPVDKMVGNVRNNGPQLILPVLSNPA
jgi:hypothetical protein